MSKRVCRKLEIGTSINNKLVESGLIVEFAHKIEINTLANHDLGRCEYVHLAENMTAVHLAVFVRQRDVKMMTARRRQRPHKRNDFHVFLENFYLQKKIK